MSKTSEAPEAAADPGLEPESVFGLHQRGEVELIDVREDVEWEAGRIAGARRIPLGGLSARAAEIPRDRTVVFYCRGGSRSGMAAEAFRGAAFDTHNMSGGLVAWAEKGLPLEPEGGRVLDRGGFPDGLTKDRVHSA